MFTPLVARAVAASLIFAIAALGALSLFHSPDSEASSFMVATQKAERRVARLPDGSTVEMSGDSAIEARYGKGRPDIRLLRGQALFRSEGRRVGKEGGSAGETWCSPYHDKKKKV